MIERLELRRWRAFEHVALDFGPGTTFVVAKNGVGKTSLTLGLAWAIFGDSSEVKGQASIRAGFDTTEATVTVRLGDDSIVTIKRSATTSGKNTATYDLDGRQITDAEFAVALTDAFGARPDVVARLSIMAGGGHLASSHRLDIKDHLYEAFGISGLRHTADEAAKALKAAVKQRESIRSVVRAYGTRRAELEQQRADLSAKVAELAEARQPLAAAFETAQAERDNVLRAATQRANRDSWLERHRDLDEQLRRLEPGLTAASLPTLISDLEAEAQRQRTLAATAAVHRQLADNALGLLAEDDPACPTCRRPFHAGDLDQAIAAQRQARADALEAAATAETATQQLEARLDQLRKLDRSLNALGPEPAEPDVTASAETVEAAMAAALSALQAHDTGGGRAQQELDGVVAALRADDDAIEYQRLELRAYRHEALAKATAETLGAAADAITNRLIEPLSQRIAWRWKLLFNEEGLALGSDGTIGRVVGDRVLPWESLSGGEQIWARLVAHLLVIGASTRLPFAWFDEPLEHLDPTARRAVATALAEAPTKTGPAQLIVTTYEHALAQQLASDIPGASIQRVRKFVAS